MISFKSVAAYRSGLMIERPSRADAKAAFKQMLRDGSERLELKPLVDHVVHRVMEAASDQELPVQFHTGYGDADADLRLADPFHLAPLAREYPDVNLVLLHGGYPFSGHLAVLAATYANIYADVSYGIPFLTSHQLYTVTHTLLGPARRRGSSTARTPSGSPSSTGWAPCAAAARSARRSATWSCWRRHRHPGARPGRADPARQRRADLRPVHRSQIPCMATVDRFAGSVTRRVARRAGWCLARQPG